MTSIEAAVQTFGQNEDHVVRIGMLDEKTDGCHGASVAVYAEYQGQGANNYRIYQIWRRRLVVTNAVRRRRLIAAIYQRWPPTNHAPPPIATNNVREENMKGSMAIVGVRLLAIWDFNDSSLFAFVAAHLKMLCSRSSIDVFFSGFYRSKLELTYLTSMM